MKNKPYEYRHIVVAGYPRSGTSLLYSMMLSSVKDYKFFEQEVSAKDVVKYNLLMVSKCPNDTKDAVYLHDKGCGFIFCVRDPRDVICSKISNGKFKLDGNKGIIRREGKELQNEGLIERHNWLKKAMQFPHYLCKYEELIKNTEKIQQEIGNYFRLDYTGRFKDFYKADIPNKFKIRMHGVRPVDTNSIGQWKCNKERISKKFKECPRLFDLVVELGYEKNNNWL